MGRAAIEGWLTLDAAKKLLAMAGQDFDALKKQARTREFKPVPLGAEGVDGDQATRCARSTRSNVVAKLEGSDPKLQGRVRRLHGALGSPRRRRAGQRRQDLQRRARQRVRRRRPCSRSPGRSRRCSRAPKRSILFLMVTAEEQGLLGSQYYADHAALSAGQDAREHQHRRRQPVGPHQGHHRHRPRRVRPRRLPARTPPPSRAACCGPIRSRRRASTTARITSTSPSRACRRSIRTRASTSSASRRTTASRSATSTPKKDYHAPSDEVKPDWDLTGAVEDAQLFFAVGYRVANADKFPEWKPGNEFKAKREKSLAK